MKGRKGWSEPLRPGVGRRWWWWGRCGAGWPKLPSCRHSGMLGVALGLWLCLVTLAHLALVPSLLVTHHAEHPVPPPCRSGTQWKKASTEDLDLFLEEAADDANFHHLKNLQREAFGPRAYGRNQNKEGLFLIKGNDHFQVAAKVGFEQRVLLTKGDSLDDEYEGDRETEGVANSVQNEGRETQLKKIPVPQQDPDTSKSSSGILEGAAFRSEHSQLVIPRGGPQAHIRSAMNRRKSPSEGRAPHRISSKNKDEYDDDDDDDGTDDDKNKSFVKIRAKFPSIRPSSPSTSVANQLESTLSRSNHDNSNSVTGWHRKTINSITSSLLRRPVTSRDTGDVTGYGTRLKEDGFLLHAYNVTASDLLPTDREVPDTRPEGCPRTLPDMTSMGPVSVVICTHNEAVSVLRRTVYSVFRQTPSNLLSDVIVVNDNSTLDDPADALAVLGDDVTQGRLHVIRTPGRQGLVRARLLGADAAKGKVLVFLDSHCECGPGWLPPLLEALQRDRTKIVSPYIDVIRSESFVFTKSPDNLQGAFNWRLEFGWRGIPPSDKARRQGPEDPIRTPVISGGLFMVERQHFMELGAYDDQLDIWGGENMELSFRAWMCGGGLEQVPCSRVGHVFRGTVPYSFPGDRRQTVLRNLARVAHVWMDEYRDFFFAAVNMSQTFDVGDLTSRRELRRMLRCRPFSWYLKNVATYLDTPPRTAVQYGQLRNMGNLLCLTAVSVSNGLSSPAPAAVLRLVACHGAENQTATVLESGQFQMGSLCILPSANKHVELSTCTQHTPEWTIQGGHIVLGTTDLCLTSAMNEAVGLQTCRPGDRFQQWEATYTFTWPAS